MMRLAPLSAAPATPISPPARCRYYDHLAELDFHPFHAREARGDHVVDHHGLNARDGIRDLGKIEVSIERLDQGGERAAIRVVREVPAVALVILGFTLAALAVLGGMAMLCGGLWLGFKRSGWL
jgi:hypothetical protein